MNNLTKKQNSRSVSQFMEDLVQKLLDMFFPKFMERIGERKNFRKSKSKKL